MNVLEFAVLLPMLVLAQPPQSPATFLIPRDMHEIWPGAKLTDADTRLFRKAMASDLTNLTDESQPDKKYTFDKVDMADVELGTLGKGVIALTSDSNLCGNGGCPIYAYVRKKTGYRKVLSSFGWAFAVVGSKAEVPDLVTASSLSGGIVVLNLYRYAGKAFSRQACETLAAKQGGAPKDVRPFNWWDPSLVVIEPCGRR